MEQIDMNQFIYRLLKCKINLIILDNSEICNNKTKISKILKF